MSGWVDFKELRSKLSFEAVLVYHGVEIRKKGEQHMGFCPLPGHDGKRNSPSFSANLDRGIFHCFGCGAKGNVLDFAALMAGVDPADGRGLRQVAIDLGREFCPEIVKGKALKGAKAKRVEEPEPAPPQLDLGEKSVVTNPPLDFELKGLDPAHPSLSERKLVPETIALFGLGFCSRGLLAGRLAIPLHDQSGKLIGYAGCVVDDAAITDENPRYRLPTSRERNGQVIEFKKNLVLYNGHRFSESSKDLIVVEGFPSVWWLTQNGFGRVVSTMGAECSDEQAELIVSLVTPDGRIWIMPDGDKAGERFAHALLLKLSPHRFVRWTKVKDGAQPTDLSVEELRVCLTA